MAGLLGELFKWQDNPIYKGFDQHRNAIGGAFAGLAGAKNLGDGTRSVLSGALGGQQIDLEEMARQKQLADQQAQLAKAAQGLASMGRDDLATAVGNGFDVNQAFSLAFNKQAGPDLTTDQSNYEYGLSHPGFAESLTNKGGQSEMSLTGTYGTDNDPKSPTFGQTILGQLGKDGIFHRTEMNGVQPLSPYDLNQQKAAGTTSGKATEQAALDLPGIVARGEQGIAVLEQLLPQVKDPKTGQMVDNPGFADQFGTFGVGPFQVPVGQIMPATPNTPKAGFQVNLDQAKSQAFLQAFDQMRGAGAISEAEGAKATQAILRANTSTSPQEFKAAIEEAIAIYRRGIENAKQKAAAAYTSPNSGAAPGQPIMQGQGFSVLGVE